MNKKTAYLFLDWYMTINELVSNQKVNSRYLSSFIRALNNLEKAIGCDLNLIILSGTSQESAMQTFTLLNNAFKEHNCSIFTGFAYEYGGFLISKDGIKKYYHDKTKLNNIDAICKKYNMTKNPNYKLYYNFVFDKINNNVLNFVNECKAAFPDKNFELYNDKYGKGLDIKNTDLNKHTFVTNYLADKHCDLVMFGGDSSQDEIMFTENNAPNKYFLGFTDFTHPKPNYILSSKQNIAGIIENLNTLTDLISTLI